MSTIRLVHWNPEEGEARASEIEKLGFTVSYERLDPGALLNALKKSPPSVLVVDLSRSPAMGRDVAVAVRIHGSTRRVPLVFIGGASKKVEGIRRILPDARFGSWEGVGPLLREALGSPPENPVVPTSALAGYSGTPLPKKLGIKAGTRVLLARAPDGFTDTLGELPPGAVLSRRYGKGIELILWFVRSTRDLVGGIEMWASRVGPGGIWIIWPKKSSAVPSDLTQAVVRKTGLSWGLVDYKIAAIDETWSGLKFAVRKKTENKR
jgi:hypothetical protein